MLLLFENNWKRCDKYTTKERKKEPKIKKSSHRNWIVILCVPVCVCVLFYIPQGSFLLKHTIDLSAECVWIAWITTNIETLKMIRILLCVCVPFALFCRLLQFHLQAFKLSIDSENLISFVVVCCESCVGVYVSMLFMNRSEPVFFLLSQTLSNNRFSVCTINDLELLIRKIKSIWMYPQFSMAFVQNLHIFFKNEKRKMASMREPNNIWWSQRSDLMWPISVAAWFMLYKRMLITVFILGTILIFFSFSQNNLYLVFLWSTRKRIRISMTTKSRTNFKWTYSNMIRETEKEVILMHVVAFFFLLLSLVGLLYLFIIFTLWSCHLCILFHWKGQAAAHPF